jgi:hypothetical protein
MLLSQDPGATLTVMFVFLPSAVVAVKVSLPTKPNLQAAGVECVGTFDAPLKLSFV